MSSTTIPNARDTPTTGVKEGKILLSDIRKRFGLCKTTVYAWRSKGLETFIDEKGRLYTTEKHLHEFKLKYNPHSLRRDKVRKVIDDDINSLYLLMDSADFGMTLQEIGDELGISKFTVQRTLLKALEKLRQHVRDREDLRDFLHNIGEAKHENTHSL